MDARFLRALFEKRRFEACCAVGLEMLHSPDLGHADRAAVALYLSLCTCEEGDDERAALYAENSVLLARVVEDWNLYGRALVQSGYSLSRVGMNRLALERFEEYLQHFGRYGPDVQRKYGLVHFDMGVVLRKMGRHEEAARHLEEAWEWGKRELAGPKDLPKLHAWRSTYAWQLLLLGRLAEAEAVIREGEAYTRQHPDDVANALGQRLDEAQLALVRGDLERAAEKSMEVLSAAGEGWGWQRADAALILYRVAARLGLRKEALGVGLLAKSLALAARRPDIVEEVNRSIQEWLGRTAGPEVGEVLQELGELPHCLRRRRIPVASR